MSLDLNKPLRLVRSKKTIRNVSALQGRKNTYAYISSDGEMEYTGSCRLDEMENIPQSRWLNVYVGTESSVSPRWFNDKLDAEVSRRSVRDMECVAVIEDKQDGSDWIVHKL